MHVLGRLIVVLGGLLLLAGSASAPVAAQLAHVPSVQNDDLPPRGSDEDSTAVVPERPAPSDAPLSHIVGGETTLYNRPNASTPVGRLPVRTPLRRLGCEDDWCRVRTEKGRTGFVPADALSNVWLRVSKADRLLYLYRGPRLVETFNIDIGYNTFADKQRRGSRTRRDHWRTPEGTFYVIEKNPRSRFYKALVLNYPTVADARRGRRNDLISEAEHDAIVEAQDEFRLPPMNTALGGWIEIHGEGTGDATNWTQGCVAVHNRVMNELWTQVLVGTPVLIE
ncbi:MAG: hypothetical protein BRD55_03905 [Bacteroidetes bacterium SW_9_63_38]|nr:MAG: hypothetical protein BRD55_03905 [Bacteroidetes bacterium SW_9_63_38]